MVRNARFDRAFRNRLAQRGIETSPLHSDNATTRELEYGELTAAERRMWTVHTMEPRSIASIIAIVWTVDGVSDPHRLARAVSAACTEFLVLSATIDPEDPRWVPRPGTVDVAVREKVSPHDAAYALGREPIDLTVNVAWRANVIAGRTPSIAFAVHHIAVDDESWAVLLDRILARYRDPSATPAYARRSTVYESIEVSSTDAQHIAEMWRHPARIPSFPDSRALQANSIESGERLTRRLGSSSVSELSEFAARSGGSLFSAFMTIVGAAVHVCTGSTDFSVHTPVVVREPAHGSDVGYHGNLVPVRIAVDPAVPIDELVRSITASCYDALEYRTVDLDALRTVMREHDVKEPDRSILVSLRRNPTVATSVDGISVRAEPVFNGTSQFPLSVTLDIGERCAYLEIDHRVSALDSDTAGALADLIELLISRTPHEPGKSVDSLTVRNRSSPLPPIIELESVPERIRRWTCERPDTIAVTVDGDRVTYQQLEEKVSSIGGALASVAATGCAVLLCEPGLARVVGLLATWNASLACVPIDPSYPIDWIRSVITAAGPSVIVTDNASAGLAAPFGIETVNADCADYSSSLASVVSPHPDSLAYIGTSSGSTGTPKLIEVTHHNLATRTTWADAVWPLETGASRVGKSSINFVDGITEIVDTLTNGAVLHLVSRSTAADPVALAGSIASSRARHLMAVPAVLDAMMTAYPAALVNLDRVVTTGAPPSKELVASLRASGIPSVRNSYGCAEVVGDVLETELGPAGEPTTLGHLPDDGSVRLLDNRLRPVRPGLTGVLYVGGGAVSRGYRGDPAATCRTFVADPERPGARLFVTGDRARREIDGTVTYLGRGDARLKVNGVRVERAEIEAALTCSDGVAAAAVVADDHGSATILTGYIECSVGVDTAVVDVTAIARDASRRLPPGVVVSCVVSLDRLPTLPSGKIDYAALADRSTEVDSPNRDETDTELTLTRIVADVLGRERVKADDDYFALGGNSLQAVDIANRAAAAGYTFTAADLFEYRTVAKLVAHRANGAARVHERGPARGKPVSLASGSRWWSAPGGWDPVVRTRRLAAGRTPSAARETALASIADVDAFRVHVTRSHRGTPRAMWTAEPSVAVTDAVDPRDNDAVLALIEGEGCPGCAVVIGSELVAVATAPQILDGPSQSRLLAMIATGRDGTEQLRDTGGAHNGLPTTRPARVLDTSGQYSHRTFTAALPVDDRITLAREIGAAVSSAHGASVTVDVAWHPYGRRNVPMLGVLADFVPAECDSGGSAYDEIVASWADRQGRRRVLDLPAGDVGVVFEPVRSWTHSVVVVVEDGGVTVWVDEASGLDVDDVVRLLLDRAYDRVTL